MPRGLAEWLAWLERQHPSAIALGLDRVQQVAGAMRLPAAIPTLTIAGTNGKGSSATLAAAIYRAAGHRVGLYTSPHLMHYHERVQIDGSPASDAQLCAAFAAVEAARGATPLTYFEFGTLAALWLFREQRVEVQVLEVGLGGRLDAVNLVDADAALLTNVGLDHQDWLGSTREAIGFEKAGIFRAQRPAIVVERAPPATVAEHAQRIGAPLLQLGRDFDVQPDAVSGGWHWRGPTRTYHALPEPGLRGAHQRDNAAGVIAAIEALQTRLPVSETAIRRALPALALRGRCESVHGVLLDVAHNRESAAVLAAFLRETPCRPTVLVLGMLADKPVEALLAELASEIDHGFAIDLPPPRGLGATVLRERAAACGITLQCCDNMATALREARAGAGADGRVLVTGSFLTVAAAIETLDHHG